MSGELEENQVVLEAGGVFDGRRSSRWRIRWSWNDKEDQVVVFWGAQGGSTVLGSTEEDQVFWGQGGRLNVLGSRRRISCTGDKEED
jgi:hypothetical protein